MRAHIYPVWDKLHAMDAENGALATQWSEMVATDCFGHSCYLEHAHYLLFFLCPMLPIVLAEADSNELPGEPGQPPQAESRDNVIQGQLQKILVSKDWWPRRILWQHGILNGTRRF